MANTLIKSAPIVEPSGGGSGGGNYPPDGSACARAVLVALEQTFPFSQFDYATTPSGGKILRATSNMNVVWHITSASCSNGYVELTYRRINHYVARSD